MNFPEWWEAPRQLIRIEGHCGLLAGWMVLRYFGKRVSAANLIEGCMYTERHGVFTVALATALKEHGLGVSFHSDPDERIGGFERRCYAKARRVGIVAKPALELPALITARKRGAIPIVFYNTESNNGHFSPLLGARNGYLRLPLAESGKMTESDFVSRWSEPEVLRQCVIANL
jgi:hypothetical protein